MSQTFKTIWHLLRLKQVIGVLKDSVHIKIKITAELRQSFSTCVYNMLLRFQSNYAGFYSENENACRKHVENDCHNSAV